MKNKFKFQFNAVLITAVTVAVVILLNAVVSTISSKMPLTVDLTRDKVYEFSNYTKEIMKALDKEVQAYALYPENAEGNVYTSYAQEYLAKYERLNKNFKVTFVDPYTNPSFTKKYEDMGKTVSVGSIILECENNVEIVPIDQMYYTSQYSGETSIDMEKKITAALVNVCGKSEKSKIYFTQGHDEYEEGQLVKVLEDEGFECEDLNIAINGIPEDASLIVMMSPSKDITPEEQDAIDKYLDNGGKALIVSEPGKTAQPRLDEYLLEWGLKINGDYVIEGDGNHAFQFQNGLPVPAPIMEEHQITQSLNKQKLVFMAPSSTSVTITEENVRRATVLPLLGTTKNSWGKINLAANVITFEDGDNIGPFSLAAISEMTDGSGGKVMAFGSVQALEISGILTESGYANGDFILNSVNYLTEKKGSSMDIRAKVISASKLTMSQTQVAGVWILVQYIIPILIVAAGIIVWLKRRYK